MKCWGKIAILLSIAGSGIITASVDNDAGGIATYSFAVSHFSNSPLWTPIPISIARIIAQKMSPRDGAATSLYFAFDLQRAVAFCADLYVTFNKQKKGLMGWCMHSHPFYRIAWAAAAITIALALLCVATMFT